MIQDIEPSKLDNTYAFHQIRPGDFLLVFDASGRILCRMEGRKVSFTEYSGGPAAEVVYLFALDERRYFLSLKTAETEADGFEYRTVREIRDACEGKEVFAAFTAWHLWRWYADSRFCGRCGGKMELHPAERALQCPACGHIVYPRINPAVIVGVIKGDCLLITRYRTGYAHNALVAGFAEIGETLEQTVKREVMEETGVRVKNIRYYKSQPWGIAQDILAGFFCEAEDDGEIRMDGNELGYAAWVKRGDIVLQPNSFSLTNEMMKMFRDGKQ